ncbi:Flp1 family type IVb pilin [Saccharibacillus deserti]|uniref:Flp1 family type IVb pilin n=1 Tax=Saccharibacillus deserti TaxID=1634444 RepID=UPI0015528DD0|nr:Flp1 family type IVb pilin [Saccharibacillus deserti]
MLQAIGSKVKGFWKEEEGLGTLEVILIIGVTLIIALIFKKQITALVTNLLSSVNTKSEEFFK